MIGRQWIVKNLRKLPGSVFLPPPNIDSGVISLTPRPAGEVQGRLLCERCFERQQKEPNEREVDLNEILET